MFNKKDIANKIYEQMKDNFVRSNPALNEKIIGISHDIIEPGYIIKDNTEIVGLFDKIDEAKVIKYVFTKFKKALHHQYKFDSLPEKKFAMVCETSSEVEKWLRPASKQFNLFYDGKRYEPDFVIETKEFMYLVEVKGEDRMKDADVTKKRNRAIKYCNVANVYCSEHKLKFWKHLFIPSKEITTTSSFNNLAERFEIK